MGKLRADTEITGLIGVISDHPDGKRLTLYSAEDRRPVAIVIGSHSYLLRALHAVGLAPPVAVLAKDDHPGLAFIGSEPANGNVKCAR